MTSTTLSLAATSAALTLLLQSAGAATPSNDRFDDSIDLGITANTASTGSNVDSSVEFGEPSPDENPDVDVYSTVWWKFSVATDGFVDVSTDGSDFDTILGIYVGNSLLSLIEVGSDNDGGIGTASKVTIAALTGLEYHIQVSGFAGEEGSVTLSISPGTGPTPPSLVSATILPSPLDVTSEGGSVTASLRIESPDGFDYGELAIYDPLGGGVPAGGFFTETSRVSGDEFSGTYEIPLAISTYSPPGTYTAELSIAETNGDTAAFGSGAMPWPGSSGTFAVINNGTVDNTPPSITSFSATPSSVDITAASQSIAVQVSASDDLSIQHMLIDVHDPDDFYLFSAVAGLSSGTIANGTWTANIPISRGSTPSDWRLNARAIDFSSKAANYQPIGNEDKVTVLNAGTVDEDAPALVNLSFSPNPVVRGNPVTVTIEFTDDLAGLATLSSNLLLDFYDGDAKLQFIDPFSLADLVAGNSVAGTIQYPTFIQPTAPVGVWDTEIHLQDGAGSAISYSNLNADSGAFPFPSGVTGQLTVVDAPGTAYELWLARYPALTGADADPNADPDGDGWSNLLELPFDGDPTIALHSDPKAANFPSTLITATDLKLQFRLNAANLSGTQGSPIDVKGRRTADLKAYSEVPLTDLGDGLFEASIPLGASRQFLSLEVVDPN